MNITDIDDKIIRRARWNHLLESYATEEHGLEDVVGDVTEALKVWTQLEFSKMLLEAPMTHIGASSYV